MRNGKLYLYIVVILAVFCGPGNRLIVSAEEISGLESLVLREEYAEGVNCGKKLLNQSFSLNKRRKIYYLTGLSYLKLGSSVKAKRYFKKAITKKADSITLNSIIGIADAYYAEKQYLDAIKRYDYILSKYKNTGHEANVCYKLARSYLRTGGWRDSKKYFRRTEKRYPLSFESGLARDILKENAFYFTVQVGSFGNSLNADKLCRKLKKRKYPVFVDKVINESITFYRVRVGKFNTKKEARLQEQKLKKISLPTRIYP
ncbi:MAG: SPOR domain-containing protein [Candidatus Omnitrophica bacterium]|nr:SPOR domain-containing protein [Candidatus Omnitrophota bacterium]